MHFNKDPEYCRVDFFKPSGKWYSTESIKFSDKDYRTTLIHDAFKNALSYSIGNSLIGMTAVCLEPYHKHSHPLSIVWKGDQHAL